MGFVYGSWVSTFISVAALFLSNEYETNEYVQQAIEHEEEEFKKHQRD
jgi:hypothetical protein